jgi:hypothetical protein
MTHGGEGNMIHPAYIDPGSGSYFFQLLIGGLLSVAVAVGAFRRKIWAFLSRKPRTPTPSEEKE